MEKSVHKKFLVLIIIGILYIFIVLKYNIGIPCIFHELTGFYCPGCGGSRAIASLFKLNFYQAFRYNPLIITLLPFACIYFFYKYILNGKRNLPNFVFYILLIIIILFAILRNVPAFSFLAPSQVSNSVSNNTCVICKKQISLPVKGH